MRTFKQLREKILHEINYKVLDENFEEDDEKAFKDIHKNNKLDKSGTAGAKLYKFDVDRHPDTGMPEETSTLLNGYLKHAHDSSYAGTRFDYKPKLISKLDNALDKSSTDRPMTVYTGIRSKPKIGKEGVTHFPAYVSASLSKHVAGDFATNKADNDKSSEKHILRIDLPTGTKAASLNHIKDEYADEGTYKHEHEILLHRGHNIKINPKPEIEHHAGQKYHIWHGSVVSHTPQNLE